MFIDNILLITVYEKESISSAFLKASTVSRAALKFLKIVGSPKMYWNKLKLNELYL